MSKLNVEIRLRHRFQTHWEGGYTKQQFDRLIQPLFDLHRGVVIHKFDSVRAVRFEFPSETVAVEFRVQLTDKMRLLHRKASFGWHNI